MRNVLITGGAGFIGSHVALRLLAAGHHVRVLDTLSAQIHGPVPAGLEWLQDHSALEFQRGSVASRHDVLRAIDGIDAVVHLASETGTGQSMYEIATYCEQNVLGTAVLLDVLANEPGHGVERIVLSSSRSVYGEGAYQRAADVAAGDGAELRGSRIVPPPRSAEQLRVREWEPVCPETGEALVCVPTRESDPTNPSSIYAATKLMQEELVRITTSSVGIGHTILRLQNVYGEGQSLNNPYTGILSIFSTRIRRGLELPIFEDGAETRDFVHVSDVANACVAALEQASSVNGIVNVGSGCGTSVLEVAQELTRSFEIDVDITVTGQYRLGDIRHNCADITRLHTDLGLTPSVALSEGLQRFSRWVLSQPLPEDRLEIANAELARRNMMG